MGTVTLLTWGQHAQTQARVEQRSLPEVLSHTCEWERESHSHTHQGGGEGSDDHQHHFGAEPGVGLRRMLDVSPCSRGEREEAVQGGGGDEKR